MAHHLQVPARDPEFADVLADLRQLARNHLLVYRVEVGRVLLERFFAGSAAAYTDMDPGKELAFTRFVETCAEELSAFRLGERTLRDCIRTHLVFLTLPPAAREALQFSHVVELTRVADPTLRGQLAVASVAGDWSVVQLKGAIGEAKAGNWYDTDADTPGSQPPPPRELPPPVPQAGRLVTRAEKWAEEVEIWSSQWSAVDASRLSKAQRQRVIAAVTALRAKLDGVERGLARASVKAVAR